MLGIFEQYIPKFQRLSKTKQMDVILYGIDRDKTKISLQASHLYMSQKDSTGKNKIVTLQILKSQFLPLILILNFFVCAFVCVFVFSFILF